MGVMFERRFFNGPVPWLVGLLWANIGILAGLAICVTGSRFTAIKAHPAAYGAVAVIFGLLAVTTGFAIANRQDAEKRALRRPIANACIGLYAVSLQVQHFMSTLQFIAHNDINGRAVDLAALREAAANVGRAVTSLAPSRVLDPADINLILHAGQKIVADVNESFAAACQALDRAVYDHRERWAHAQQLTNGALAMVGKTVAALQGRA